MADNRYGDWVLVGRVWYNTKTGAVLPVIQGGALPATDAFTTGSDQNLTTYSASWSIQSGASEFTVYAATDVVGTGASVFGRARWNADSFNNNQYGQIKLASGTGGQWIGPIVRASTTANTSYNFDAGIDVATYLIKTIDGSDTELSSNSLVVYSVGDVVRIEADGTTITCKKNGSVTGCPGAQTDSDISSGYAGISGWNGARGDDWEGGDLEAPAGLSIPVAMHHYQFNLDR